MQLLKIVSIGEVQTGTSGRKFRKVGFKSIYLVAEMKITKNQAPVSRNIFDDFTDEAGKQFKGDQLFKDLNNKEQELGGFVEGQITTFNTTAYQVNNNEVYSFTCVVFSNEDAVKVANNNLKANKACVVDENGVPTVDEKVLKGDVVTA